MLLTLPVVPHRNGLTNAGIELDRKVLAELAVHEPEAFNAIAGQAKAALV